MTKRTVTFTKLQASATRVLTDGYIKTSVGGCVFCPEGKEGDWSEMTEAKADELIAANTPEEGGEENVEA